MFNASRYLKYELYRINEDENKLIKEVDNRSGKVLMSDDNLEQDVMYSYYLVAKQTNNSTGKMVKSKKSVPVKIIINSKNSNELINYINNRLEKAKKRRKKFKWF